MSMFQWRSFGNFNSYKIEMCMPINGRCHLWSHEIECPGIKALQDCKLPLRWNSRTCSCNANPWWADKFIEINQWKNYLNLNLWYWIDDDINIRELHQKCKFFLLLFYAEVMIQSDFVRDSCNWVRSCLQYFKFRKWYDFAKDAVIWEIEPVCSAGDTFAFPEYLNFNRANWLLSKQLPMMLLNWH